MPKALKYILYTAAFIGSYILFVYWMFPMEAVKGRIITSLETTLGSGYGVHIGDITTHWLSGVRLKNILINQTSQGKEENIWKIDQATARVGLFSLVFGSPKISFDGKMGKTRLGGTLRNSDQGFSADCSFSNLDISQIQAAKQMTGLNLTSSIDGEIQVNYDAKQPLRTVGKMDIAFDKLNLKGGEIPLGEMGSFPLPDLSIANGGSTLKALIDKGAINLENFKLKGDDLNIELSGKVFLSPQISKYRMNLQGKFQLSPKLWTTLDPILPAKWLEELKKQKGADDNLPLSVSGQLSSPQIYSGTVAIFPFKPF